MKFLNQYRNLSKEIYVLFFGRMVTSMGSLIWPVMTLILKNKLGYNATIIATIVMVMSFVQMPMVLVGGKLADYVNRKWLIVICDLVTVSCYLAGACLPLSIVSVVLFYVASVFATIEGPSYEALIADLSDSDSREKAYSLQYLGGNLGVVLAPTLGGLLFKNYLNVSFAITGFATLSSTILIVLFIKRLSVPKENNSVYEQKREGVSLMALIKERKILLLYFVMTGFSGLVYGQFNYLLPLNLERFYGATGATIFGTLASTNGLVVVLTTPMITTVFRKMRDVRKIFLGEFLISLGMLGYATVGKMIPVYYCLMVIFTLGEVFRMIGGSPYCTRRMPSTHWGRIHAITLIFQNGFSSVGNILLGKIVDTKGFSNAWMAEMVFAAILLCFCLALNLLDKKEFPLLYKKD